MGCGCVILLEFTTNISNINSIRAMCARCKEAPSRTAELSPRAVGFLARRFESNRRVAFQGYAEISLR